MSLEGHNKFTYIPTTKAFVISERALHHGCHNERCSQFLEEYNLRLWYVPGLENRAIDACFRLTSRQLMDIQNATGTGPFVVPLVETWISPEGEPLDKVLHVLEDAFSHNEVWLQPYNHLYVWL